MALSCQSWSTDSWCVSAWGGGGGARVLIGLSPRPQCWSTAEVKEMHSSEIMVSTAQTRDIRHELSVSSNEKRVLIKECPDGKEIPLNPPENLLFTSLVMAEWWENTLLIKFGNSGLNYHPPPPPGECHCHTNELPIRVHPPPEWTLNSVSHHVTFSPLNGVTPEKQPLMEYNAVVTPLRKAVSYEQRKTNLRKFPVTVTYYHVVPRITQH